MVAHLSSVILEHYFLRRVLRSPEEHLFSSDSHIFWAKLFPGNFKPFPQETQDRILNKARQNNAPLAPRPLFFIVTLS